MAVRSRCALGVEIFFVPSKRPRCRAALCVNFFSPREVVLVLRQRRLSATFMISICVWENEADRVILSTNGSVIASSTDFGLAMARIILAADVLRPKILRSCATRVLVSGKGGVSRASISTACGLWSVNIGQE